MLEILAGLAALIALVSVVMVLGTAVQMTTNLHVRNNWERFLLGCMTITAIVLVGALAYGIGEVILHEL